MQGWQITCGKCGIKSGTDNWLESKSVLLGKCHFECPACGTKIRREIVGIKRIPVGGELMSVPERIKVVEVV